LGKQRLSGAECSLPLTQHKGNTNLASKGFQTGGSERYGLISPFENPRALISRFEEADNEPPSEEDL